METFRKNFRVYVSNKSFVPVAKLTMRPIIIWLIGNYGFNAPRVGRVSYYIKVWWRLCEVAVLSKEHTEDRVLIGVQGF